MLLRVKLEWWQARSREATPTPSSAAAMSVGASFTLVTETPSSPINQPSGNVRGMLFLPKPPPCHSRQGHARIRKESTDHREMPGKSF